MKIVYLKAWCAMGDFNFTYVQILYCVQLTKTLLLITDITNSPQLSPGPVEGAFDTVIVLYHLADIAQLRIHTIATCPQYAILTVSFQMKALFSLH